MLTEGGHAVSNVVKINNDNVADTVADASKTILSSLGLSIPESARLLGSAGKKDLGGQSGDLDIAVDYSVIMKKNNVSEDQLLGFIEKKCQAVSPDVTVNKGTKIISCAYPIVNSDGKQPDSFVQMDLMLVESDILDYSEFSFWSPKESESKYKGLYRTSLLITIAKVINMKVIERALDKSGQEVPATWERLFMDLRTGLFKGKQTSRSDKTGQIGKQKRTFEKVLVSNKKDEVIKLLLGKYATEADTNSLESLWKFIHSPKFPYKDKVKEIESTYVSDLEDQKIQAPEIAKGILEEESTVDTTVIKGKVHLTHLEDIVFEYGKQGINTAVNMVQGFLTKFEGGAVASKHLTVSEKIDGSPAVFFGKMPDGKFFVALWKSAFGGVQKICFSLRDIDKFYSPREEGRAEVGIILKSMFAALRPAFKKDGYACKGDLLWYNMDGKKESVIDGKQNLTFKPNTTLYAIPRDPKSSLFKNADRARLGVVIHGAFKPHQANTDGRIDVDELDVEDVKVLAADIDSSTNIFCIHPYIDNLDVIKGQEPVLKEIEDTLSSVKETNDQIDSMFDNDFVSGQNPYIKLFKANFSKFMTHQIVSAGKVKTIFNSRDESDFLKTFQEKIKEFMAAQLEKELPAMKTPSGRKLKSDKYEEFYKWSQDTNEFKLMLSCFFGLHNIKLLLVNLMDSVEHKLGKTFVVDRENDFELKAVKPEGYVFLSDGNMIKLVDRIEFTKNNLMSRNFGEEIEVSEKAEVIVERTIVDEVTEDILSAMEAAKNLGDGWNDDELLEAASSMKNYSAIYVGRFQPPTTAHVQNIVNLSKSFKEVYILVSKAENITPKYLQKNPLSDEERISLFDTDPKLKALSNVNIKSGPTYMVYGINSVSPTSGKPHEEEVKALLGIPAEETIVIAMGKEDDRYYATKESGKFFDVNSGKKPNKNQRIGIYGIDLITSGEEGKVSASTIRDAIVSGDLDTAERYMAGSDTAKTSVMNAIREKLQMISQSLVKKPVAKKKSVKALAEEDDMDGIEKVNLDDAFDIVLDALEE